MRCPIACLAPFAIALLLAPTHAQSIAYDGFGNGPRADLAGSAGGTGWTSAWFDGGTDPTTVGGPGLVHQGLATTAGGAITPAAAGSWPSSYYQRSFAVPAGANGIYVSFLLRDDAGSGSWGGISFGQYPYRMTVGAPLGMYAFGLMTSNGIGNVTNRPLVQGQTVLVVVAIQKNTPAAGITYRLYLDPAIGMPEPAFADAAFGLSMVQALPGAVAIDNGTGFTTDELRVGTTWSSVLPPQVSNWTDLGFAKPGANGAPHLSGFGPLAGLSVSGVQMTNARPTTTALLVIGTQIVNQPLLGGILVPDAAVVMAMATDGVGAAGYQTTLPAGLLAGLPLRFQYWVVDPAATFGFAASNGLQGVTQ